jgi:hypothetical protein
MPAKDFGNDPLSTPQPGTAVRDSRVAMEIQRGATRLLLDLGLTAITEFTLANGRRADVAALARDGELWIVEIKSSVADFRSDQKWRDYPEFADKFFFAVRPDFPHDLLPAACGLILADSYGGELVRTVPSQPLPAARRKAITLRFARTAALRLTMQLDPGLAGRCEAKDV